MDLFIYIFIAIIIAVIITTIRPVRKSLDAPERGIIQNSIGWCLVIYGLILGFSINIFYTRYIEIRNTIVTDVTNLQITTKFFKSLNAMNVVESIERYTESVINDLVPMLKSGKYSEKTAYLYWKMNQEIVTYVRDHPTVVFDNNILIRMSTDEKFKQILNEINISQYYIKILWFLFIFVLIPLFFISSPDKVIQFILDSSLLIILVTCIYLCSILNNPFMESPVSLKLAAYTDLLNEIKR